MSDPSTPARRTVAGLAVLASRYDLILCDAWGVLHDGHRVFPKAADALARFRAAGGTAVVLTNAPRPSARVTGHFRDMGLSDRAFDAVVTSGDASVGLIAARGDVPIHHLGPKSDLGLFDEVRRATGRAPRLTGLDEAALVVCTGIEEDDRRNPDAGADVLEAMRARELDMICANPDIVAHIGDALLFCAGALAQRYERAGGRVFYAGKPHPPIYGEALRVAAEARGRPIARDRVLAIGDGLHSDIAGARAQGIDSLFVTSGIHRDDDDAAPERAAGFAPTAVIDVLRW